MSRSYQLRIREDSWKATTQGLSAKMKGIVNDKVENHIKSRPYDSEPLRLSLEGLWSYNKLETDSRIIYAICEDCRKRQFTSVNNCIGCGEIPDNTIMLWAFGGHGIYEKLGRQREKAWKKAKKKRKQELKLR